MVFIRLVLLCMMSIIGSLSGAQVEGSAAESKNVFDVGFSCGKFNTDTSIYCDQKYIDYCNKHGIFCVANEPFFEVSKDNLALYEVKHELKDQFLEAAIKKRLNPITHLPIALFVEEKNFKNVKSHLFDIKFQVNDKTYTLRAILQTDFTGITPQAVLNQFKKLPNYGYGGGLRHMDQDLEDELIAAGIIAKVGGKIVHGPNGYFGKEEYEKALREYEKQQDQLQLQPEKIEHTVVAPTSTISRFQKIMFGSLLAGLGGGMYLLYKKYTDPATSGEVDEGVAATVLNVLRNAYNDLRVFVGY